MRWCTRGRQRRFSQRPILAFGTRKGLGTANLIRQGCTSGLCEPANETGKDVVNEACQEACIANSSPWPGWDSEVGYIRGIGEGSLCRMPVHELKRRQLRARRRGAAHQSRIRTSRRASSDAGPGSAVSLASLDPALEAMVPLTWGSSELMLAKIDQDGFALPSFETLWDAPTVDEANFMPRSRTKISIVDREGLVGSARISL